MRYPVSTYTFSVLINRLICCQVYSLIRDQKLKSQHLVTVPDQLVQFFLRCPLMIPILHTVKVQTLTSGEQFTLRESENFCKLFQWKLLGI